VQQRERRHLRFPRLGRLDHFEPVAAQLSLDVVREVLGPLLADPALRARTVGALCELTQTYGYDGLNLDF